MTQHENNDWRSDRARPTGQSDTPGDQPTDTAAEALAGALKLSFRLLTVIMVLVVVAFLLTGVRQVKTDQIGIRSVFGRVVGTAEPGLTYTWPFPIGQMDIVDRSKRELTINDFWMYRSEADMTKPLSEIRPRKAGLQPGWDGALLTGDGNLLHVMLVCNYGVGRGRDPQLNVDPAVLFLTNVDDQNLEQARKAGQPLHSEQIIRSVICRAAIHVAATQTAEALRTDTSGFTRDVRDLAQQVLDEMHTGLEIRAVNAVGVSWPLLVLRDVDKASSARQDIARRRSDAETAAESQLFRTAGADYEVLVGKLDGSGQQGLIHKYALARREGREQEAAALLDAIDAALEQTTGRAQTVIQQAYSQRDTMIEPIKGRLARFEELLPQYRRDPAFVIAQLWADTRDAILAAAAAEKFYVTKGDGRIVVKINRDPAVARALQRRLLESEGSDEEE